MTKVKLKEATKEINQKAGAILEESARIRRNAESLLQSLQKQRTQMQREKEEAQKRQQVQQHTKAWTMPDDETVQEAPAVAPVAQPKAPAAEAAPAPKPAAAKPAAPAPEKAAPAAVKKEEKPAVKEQPKQEPKAEAPSAPAEKPAAAPVEAVKPAEKPAPAAAAQPPVRPAVAPAPRVLPGRPGQPTGVFAQRAQGGYPPRQGQPSRPGQPTGVFAQRQQGGYPPRPGQGGPRPQGQGGFAPRPQGQGNFAPRPGQGGPRPQGQGAPRPGQGGPRPGGMGQRPQQGSRAARGPELAPVVEKERVSNHDPNKKQYIRQHDPERVAKSRKQLAKESANMNGGMDDEVVRGGKRARAGKKQPSAQQMMAPIHIDKAYMTAEHITVKDLTERIGKPAGEILKKLFLLGIMANINSELDFDTASLVCTEFGVELEMKLDRTAEDALTEETGAEDTEDQLQPRPPVITIMGHVDHGKTSLLDYIRKSHVTAGEAGGITQHIGAYTVNLNGRIITFLDTPGHEAFTAMRARGTQATDIAVLVVAADDGVMPQTVESINHARAAGVPIIVAINKMDKEGANPDRVKQDLTAYNLVPEEWGGDTIMAPVSALTGEGVDDLLEMILLQADVMQLRANPNRMARGVIIEAKLDKNRGPLATVLLKNGTLHVGDNIVAGMASGRVRAMLNDRGERVKEAGPSMPVEIAGFTEVPEAGDDMMAVADDRLSRQVAQERREKMRAARTATTKVSLDNLFDNINEGKLKNLNLIVKADVQGSVEAVKQALEKLSNDEVKVHILHSAVGAITKDDVNLASAFGAIIIGFNIRPDASAREAAAREEVDIRLYRIIYQAIEDIEAAMKGMLAPQYREEIIGHAEVRSVFKVSGVGMVAGCYVKDGKLQRNASVRLVRDNIVVFDGKLSSLRRFKDDVKEVAAGYECGVGLENYNDIKENDEIECFIQQEIER
ncbi:MAG: translation initiation factor IF-2 [Eubacteriales bacterium]|nr:translation initiation factor IF-2 [Eubacteriales bacterium]